MASPAKRKASAPSSSTSAPALVAPSAGSEPKQSAWSMLLVFPILSILAALSVVTFLYQRVVDPLYGGVPTQLHLDKVIWAGSILGGLGPTLPGWSPLLMAGVLLSAMPASSYWVAIYTGRWGSPLYGPVATHALVLFPAIYLGITLIKKMVTYLEAGSQQTSMIRYTVLPGVASSIIGFQSLWAELPFFSSYVYSDNQILLVLGGLAVAVWAVFLPHRSRSASTSSSTSSNAWLFVIPAVILPILPSLLPYLLPPTLQASPLQPYVNPNFPLRILSSVPSVTGQIVVGESIPPPDWVPGMPEEHPYLLRYLRASHSLLGGVWTGFKITSRTQIMVPQLDRAGRPIGDSIYSAFVLQEAARLVDREDRAIKEGDESALIIGLGAGIAATAFANHKVQTTIVEIDPAVYNASRQFFGLPDLGPDRVFLEDARRFVHRRKEQVQAGDVKEKFDYVVHDCFSGGGVPGHIFSLQFWDDLKEVMNPEGVVAVNFAGKLGSDPSKAILLTLQKAFGQCRAFHDGEGLTPEKLSTEFINMVFFCSPSTKPLTFRTPKESDYLGSHLRAHVFDTLAEREVDVKLIRGELDVEDEEKWLLTDGNNKLGAWQKEGALEHWTVMRKILPEAFWTTY
ncbi:hypothetical protein EWM64_g5497 [Hericium alpestre]|uniref:PABS domain-containing protein n=1 Tax=Hericium alpestre TaxID=135208 RepID=A0A4Y9ZUG8_9AGAM|nr:hypothetical protein EWM64_g5497 [Hericium alpestre]